MWILWTRGRGNDGTEEDITECLVREQLEIAGGSGVETVVAIALPTRGPNLRREWMSSAGERERESISSDPYWIFLGDDVGEGIRSMVWDPQL